MSDAPPDPRPSAPVRSPVVAGLLGRCPRCSQGAMFKSFFALADRCGACGLDYRFADVGDGPSFFASFIGGFVVLGAGVWLQIAYDPPAWVYALTFIILGPAVCLGLIRLVKGVLVSLQYANKAGEGRIGS